MEVEILGFAIAEIQEYVEKFCKDDDGTRMWNLIQESAELLSLCYIPIICFIVCFTLKKCIEQEKCISSVNRRFPRTLTELYKRAMRAILWDHHPTCKNLKRLAKNGMDKGELIFEFETKDLIAK